ncbi:uncharacterized protein JCM6883_003953 [Sporobolomyces salmoneus]|uniref:uncharacterized protein n=1 Tax=Sporobolomyces salmoneus TaxID=183962 RepID=UPI003171CBFF
MPILRPSPILHVGALPDPLPALSSIPHLPSDLSLLETLEVGQLFRKWDFVSQFNEDCLRPSEIEPLRRRSDDLADLVVEKLGFVGHGGGGRDAYVAVKEYVEDKSVEREEGDPVVEFWEEMNRLPPPGVCGFESLIEGEKGKSKIRFTPLDAFEELPAEPTLAEGQRVFWKYSGQIFTALMHFSLAGGFSSPKLAAVMHETNYLTSNAKEATYKRLLETTLFVLDAMEDMTVGTGRGWKSAMRVRLLHAQVRRRIAQGKGRFNKYDQERDGIAINQADLLAVLGAFAVGPVWSMTRNGFSMSPREKLAYQVAWRHVGFYLGIDPSLLVRYYGRSFETTESSFASLAYAIFPSGDPPSDPYKTPQYKILSSVSARPPRGKRLEHHLELCRLCIGPQLAEQLALPRGEWKDVWTVEVERLMSWSLMTFGDFYSRFGGTRGKRWESRRQEWFRWVVKLLVIWQLGEKRTVFAWREEAKHGEKLGLEEGEDADLQMGPAVGKRVKKEWTSLLIELGSQTFTALPIRLYHWTDRRNVPTSSPLLSEVVADMSWRAPPSRPAPPVTSSSTIDQLFVVPSSSSLGTSTSSSSSRSRNPSSNSSVHSTSNGSAHALLSRKMQEISSGDGGNSGIEDDRVSIRSSRGTLGRNGNARQRAGSSTSTNTTTTTRGTIKDVDGSEISLRAVSGETVGEPMEMQEEEETFTAKSVDKGKGKAIEPPSPSKRARLNSHRRRTNSNHSATSSSLSNLSSSSSASSVPPSRSSSSHIAPLQPSRPIASTSTSSNLSVSPSQGFLSPKRWIGRPAATSSLASTTSKMEDSLHGGIESGSDKEEQTSSSNRQPHPTMSLTDSSASSTSSTDGGPEDEDDPTTPKAERVAINLSDRTSNDRPVDARTTRTTTAAQTGGSWLSLLTSRVYGSSTDLAQQGKEEGGAELEVKMDVDPTESESAVAVQDLNGVEVKDESNDGTLRQTSPTQPYDSNTLTPRTLRPSRSSWWLWGSSTEPEPEPEPEPEESRVEAKPEVAPSEPSTVQEIASPPIDTPRGPDVSAESGEDEEMSTSMPKHVTRSWLQTIWGESPEELAERRKREAKALRMVVDKANLGIEGTPERKMIEAPPEEVQPSTSVNSTTSYLESSSSSISEAPKQLRRKTSSWAIFSRANPVASSAASTRSRTSSHQADANSSLPPSPTLRPQPDGPVKPLTGSIRSTTPRRRERTITPAESEPPIGNLVLPTFNDTFLRAPRSFPPKKSNLTRAVSLVSAYLFSHPPATSPPPTVISTTTSGMPVEIKDDPAEKLPKALEIMGEPSRLANVKRVVCIGVHGWFPNARLKSVLGEPTGTSVKFATMMHDAVQAYLESSGVESFNIQAIALEGEGQVEDRVNKLYSQLSDRVEWLHALKKADVVFLATHSQGTVVSTQLLARMLDQNLIVGTQTHLLAMCGIAQGPFVYLYQSIALAPYVWVESAAAKELFEFQDAESVVSIRFLESLRVILNSGIKVTVVGSLNDQVVPLYSALFSGVSHPAIVRAAFIDSDAFQESDFLANLVVFSTRLRNAGLSDHDLVYHLSEALAGALTGVGHSKIYEEEAVFNLAVRHQFETTLLVEAPTHLDIHAQAPPLQMSFQPRDRRNPYLLTWALRGITEDPHVRQLFGNELKALGEAYETWKPQTKILKDCKLKLEGIRMITRNNAGKL